jgi:hypothetical protein
MIDIREFAARACGLRPEAIDIVPRAALEHQANRLYEFTAGGRHLIVKEFMLPDEKGEAAGREYKALMLLAPLDLAPQPVFYDPALGPLVDYEFLPGEMWNRRRPDSTALGQLAEVWLKVNAVQADHLWISHGYERPLAQGYARWQGYFEAYADWSAANFPTGQAATGACLAVLAQCRAVVELLTAAKPKLCFCRADPRFANIIQRPDGRLGLIDWEDCGLRDPARDLADVLLHPNQEDLLSEHAWQAFVRPYLAGQPAERGEIAERAHLYRALFPVFWLGVIMNQGLRLARSGKLAGWSINGLSPNVRLRRYLARAQAWPNLQFANKLEQLSDLNFFPLRES